MLLAIDAAGSGEIRQPLLTGLDSPMPQLLSR